MTTPGPNDPIGSGPRDPNAGQSGQGWGQQPPPAGPPQPGQPPQQFGQQGPQGGFGQDQQGQPWAGAGASGQGPVQPEKPSWKKRLPLVIGAVVVALALALGRNLLGGGEPEVGDCTDASPTQLEVVDCDSDEAAYRVAGVLEDVSQNDLEGDQTLCTTDYPDSVAYAVTETDPAEQGTGFCLESI
ncbi:MAG: hypothetical protein JWQ53_3049 [Klenkia sp.]|nr:hypothetical protein [Klenkia sp.]